jgi:hypothetical protein
MWHFKPKTFKPFVYGPSARVSRSTVRETMKLRCRFARKNAQECNMVTRERK